MDEFQDTNGQQARLLELVRPPDRFYAVGDINQSIFGFRHAEPEGFTAYRDDVQARGRTWSNCVDNFRSRADILRAVETVTAGTPGIEDRALVAGRKFDDPPDCPVEVIGRARNSAVEAQNRVAAPHPGVCPADFAFEDVAVLVRNTEVIRRLHRGLRRGRHPLPGESRPRFLRSREVNDLTHLLRVIANPRDEISLAAVLRSPLVEVVRRSAAAPASCSDGETSAPR